MLLPLSSFLPSCVWDAQTAALGRTQELGLAQSLILLWAKTKWSFCSLLVPLKCLCVVGAGFSWQKAWQRLFLGCTNPSCAEKSFLPLALSAIAASPGVIYLDISAVLPLTPSKACLPDNWNPILATLCMSKLKSYFSHTLHEDRYSEQKKAPLFSEFCKSYLNGTWS